jgi:hypothetical protein
VLHFSQVGASFRELGSFSGGAKVLLAAKMRNPNTTLAGAAIPLGLIERQCLEGSSLSVLNMPRIVLQRLIADGTALKLMIIVQ